MATRSRIPTSASGTWAEGSAAGSVQYTFRGPSPLPAQLSAANPATLSERWGVSASTRRRYPLGVTAPNEPDPPAGEAPQAPLPTRFGLLTIVTLAVVGIGVAVAAVFGGGDDAGANDDRRSRFDGISRTRLHRAAARRR